MTASRWLLVTTRGLEMTSPRPCCCMAESSMSSRWPALRIDSARAPAGLLAARSLINPRLIFGPAGMSPSPPSRSQFWKARSASTREFQFSVLTSRSPLNAALSLTPLTPNRAPSSRATDSVAMTTRASMTTWSTGRSITRISSFISATFLGVSLIMRVLVRASATSRPRCDMKPVSVAPPAPCPPWPPPMPRALLGRADEHEGVGAGCPALPAAPRHEAGVGGAAGALPALAAAYAAGLGQRRIDLLGVVVVDLDVLGDQFDAVLQLDAGTLDR